MTGPVRDPSRPWPLWAAGALGFFTVAAQAALLRDALVLFHGSELSIGTFFFAWFAGVGAGAAVGRPGTAVRRFAARHAAVLLAVQPAVALAGAVLLALARSLGGVAPWEPTPYTVTVAGALVAAAPLCVLTGVLFPVLCDLVGPGPDGSTRGYLAEALGAVGGGLLATAGFAAGLDGVTVVAGAGLVPAAAAVAGSAGRARWAVAGVGIVLAALALPPAGTWARDALSAARVRSLLAGATAIETVRTPYQEVVTARVGPSVVVLAGGEIASVFPPGPDDAADAALLASQPGARRLALVLGEGRIGLAAALARYFAEVEVVSADGEAQEALRRAWATSGAPPAALGRVRFRVADPRVALRDGDGRADLVVVAAGEARTLAANRLLTVEALGEARGRLAPGGVAALPVRSAEDFLGTERLRVGQSAWRTLAEVFPAVEVVPGDPAWLLGAATAGTATADAATLAARYRAFVPDPAPYPPEHFATRVVPERQAWVRELLSAPPPGDGVNRDGRPLATFLALLDSLRETGAPGPRALWALHDAGAAVPLAWGLLGLLLLARGRVRSRAPAGAYAARVLIAVAGAASIVATVTILGAWQARAGALYGDVGAAAALSMAGLAAGAAAGRRLPGGPRFAAAILSLASGLLMIGMAALVGVAADLGTGPARLALGSAVAIAGAVAGAAWPVAAALGAPAVGASGLQGVENVATSLAAGVVGTVVLALYGAGATLLGLAGAFAAALVVVLLDCRAGASAPAAVHPLAGAEDPALQGGGLLWFLGLAALAAWHLGGGSDALPTRLSSDAVQGFDPASAVTFAAAPFDHHRLEGVRDPDGSAAVAVSGAVAPEVRGYGGPLAVAVSVGEDGRIRRVRLETHAETPAYLRDLDAFLEAFRGRDARDLSTADLPPGLDAMTGATVTSRAVARAAAATARGLAGPVLGLPLASRDDEPSWAAPLGDVRVLWVVLALAGTLWIHRRGGRRARLAFLVVTAALGGALLNVGLSASWVVGVLRGDLPSFRDNAPLVLLGVGALGIAVFQGPAWCAHGCPLGAASELVSRLGGRVGVLQPTPGPWADRARGVKYVLLAALALVPFAADPASALAWDPLASAFRGDWGGPTAGILALVAVGSLLFFRFWCRIFCPVGAAFHLLNGVAARIGRLPARRYDRCDLGVRGPRDVDCLQCNRCVREPVPARPGFPGEDDRPAAGEGGA